MESSMAVKMVGQMVELLDWHQVARKVEKRAGMKVKWKVEKKAARKGHR